MNRDVFINLTIISLTVGFLLGELAVVPYIGTIVLLFMLFLSAPVAITLLIMLGKLDLTTIKDSIIQGAVSGFFANLTFSFGYCITTALLFTLWKYTKNYFLTAMIVNSPVFLLITVVVFVGVLAAITNAFSGFCLYYIINHIRDCYEKKHTIQNNEGYNNDEL